jgi:cupin fold WbuC family metalloprotein
MEGRHDTITLGAEDLAALREAARGSDRRRAARPVHKSYADPVQRVLMAAEWSTYVGPHRHPDKPWEMMVLLEGEIDVLLFDDAGVLRERYELRADGRRVIEYAADHFHAAVVGSPGAVVMEVKEGPYEPTTAKLLPDWAPEEGTPDAPDFREVMRELTPGQSVESVFRRN